MGTYRRVEADQAGPDALGILVPPGQRTFVILRPRSAPLDLVVVRADDPLVYWQMSHDEASATAQRLFKLLLEHPAVPAAQTHGGGRTVSLELGPLTLLACPRVPGQPYQPLLCGDEAAARAAVATLTDVLTAPEGAEREVYFNVRFFET